MIQSLVCIKLEESTEGDDVEMDRVKTYPDSETRRVRRASSQITYLCRFEQNALAFNKGLMRAIEGLKTWIKQNK